MVLAPLAVASDGRWPDARVGNHVKDVFTRVMRVLRVWIAGAALMCVAGCANGGGSPTSPSPLTVVTPTVPSSCAVPGVPGDLSAEVTGSSVNLSWSAVDEALDYVVVVGTSPTRSDTLFTNTIVPHHSIETMESGTHFARVHAHNWCGTSEASEAIAFKVTP
jgi:hypothetical protein